MMRALYYLIMDVTRTTYRDPAYKFAHFLIFIANTYIYGVCKVFRVFHNKHLIDPSHTRYCYCVYLAWQ